MVTIVEAPQVLKLKMVKLIDKFSKLSEFQKYKKIKPKKVEDIYRLRDYVSLKLVSLGI